MAILIGRVPTQVGQAHSRVDRRVLHRPVDQGNTMIVIEHNLDVIKTADWVIDLGPEGGNGGGKVVAMGTPEEVAEVEGSWTGRYLRGVLANPRTEC
ncbi:MAG: hypothetical protein AMXMBFR19_09300 [Chthonomonadaceae bacterium]|uniref:UvrABC system protein A n=1 Tax=Candidatus Nitrosymbiomonas proteolyticus TaxID=2608984 RepID=A0A809RA92_9BACT|nr:excinuclease ABC subunit A [Candidatus Nitrosymbiomonas proteolyticus]